MNSYISLVGAILIGGLMLVSFNNFNLGFTDDYNDILQSSETSNDMNFIIAIISDDFNRIGLDVKKQNDSIISFSTNKIVFKGDIDNDGDLERVTYCTSDTTDLDNTLNPGDKILYRNIDDEEEIPLVYGLRTFELTGFDLPDGNVTNNPKSIRTIGISIELQSSFPVNDKYNRNFWQTRLSPPNLRRF